MKMSTKIEVILLAIIGVSLMGCTRAQYIPVESYKVDSISQRSELLMQRVQSLMNEIKVWEQRRDSISSSDSVSVRDSIVLHINEAGDVVSMERYRDRTYKSDRASSTENKTTSEINHQYVDSLLTEQKSELKALIEESRQVPLPVEKPLSKWEELKIEAGSIFIGVFVSILVIAVIWLINRIRNKR